MREILKDTRYGIDFFQREYAWQEKHLRELLDDLSQRFLNDYDEGHERAEVERYGHYFLGPIVVSHKDGLRYIVDGQQRLTTLTLLLIYLHHASQEREDASPVEALIFSRHYGKRSFNLDVASRRACMEALFQEQPFDATGEDASVKNLVARYADLEAHFPDSLLGKALPYFIDWLCENVQLVEIQTFSDEDAYTIFETMNDRGRPLSLPDMLKGYLLANVRGEDTQRRLNELWRRRLQALRESAEGLEVDFFKAWLRA
ncbi:MAG: DUF262 domain-containing protein, partial [Myxococcota bacterium]